MITQSCYRCTFEGYGCNYYDDSTIRLDSESYSFRDENIRVTDIYENDSLVLIHYSFSRKGNITGSNVNIGFGFIIKLELKKLSDDNFIFNSGSVEFIKDNVWGDFYYFDSHNIDLIEYKSCECQIEVGNPRLTPEKLILNFQGVISNETEQKAIEFDIQYETRKIEIKSC
jgi:hypothetical protein